MELKRHFSLFKPLSGPIIEIPLSSRVAKVELPDGSCFSSKDLSPALAGQLNIIDRRTCKTIRIIKVGESEKVTFRRNLIIPVYDIYIGSRTDISQMC